MIITKSHTEEATARPWRVDHNARVEIKQDTDEWSSMIATVYKSGRCNGNNYRMPALANAQLIVTAVNSYSALQAQNKLLRAACEAARAWICRVSNQYILATDEPHTVLAKLRAALEVKNG